MSSGHYNSCFPGYTVHTKLVHQLLCAAENPQTVKILYCTGQNAARVVYLMSTYDIGVGHLLKLCCKLDLLTPISNPGFFSFC